MKILKVRKIDAVPNELEELALKFRKEAPKSRFFSDSHLFFDSEPFGKENTIGIMVSGYNIKPNELSELASYFEKCSKYVQKVEAECKKKGIKIDYR